MKKSDGLLCKRNKIKYSFVTQNKKIWPVILMCRVLDIKSNNYYSYHKRKAQSPNEFECNERELKKVA
jgi:putative transposase